MGYYIRANELRKSLDDREILSLSDARARFSRWDVFVSHKSEDTRKALDIAEKISRNGLSVWVDIADSTVKDGPDLADYISDVLQSSRSLLAVITSATKSSWWVPFEIGIAFEKEKLLASHGNRIHLPSFLYKWPNVQSDAELEQWCREVHSISKGAAYVSRMRNLATKF